MKLLIETRGGAQVFANANDVRPETLEHGLVCFGDVVIRAEFVDCVSVVDESADTVPDLRKTQAGEQYGVGQYYADTDSSTPA